MHVPHCCLLIAKNSLLRRASSRFGAHATGSTAHGSCPSARTCYAQGGGSTQYSDTIIHARNPLVDAGELNEQVARLEAENTKLSARVAELEKKRGCPACPASTGVTEVVRWEQMGLSYKRRHAPVYACSPCAGMSGLRAVKEPLAGMAQDSTVLPIKLIDFFGPVPYTTGVSYDPYVCFPDLKTVFPGMCVFAVCSIRPAIICVKKSMWHTSLCMLT